MKYKSVTIPLLDVIFFFAFLPFVGPFITANTDLQPFYIIGILIWYLANLKSIILKNSDIIAILLSVTIAITIYPQVRIIDSINILILPFIILFFKFNQPKLQVLRVAIAIYIIFLFLWVYNKELAYVLQNLLVREINTADSFGTRGFAILSTEPGLYAGIGVLLIEIYLKLKGTIEFRIYERILLIIFFMSIFLSLSGNTLVYLFVFFIYRIRNIRSTIFVGFILYTCLFLLTRYFPESRFALFANSTNQFVNIFLSDSSFMYRLAAILSSIISFTNYPFGVLHGDITRNLLNIYHEYYFNPKIGMTWYYHDISTFGRYLSKSGVPFLLLLFLLFREKFNLKEYTYLFLTMCFSYTLLFPLTYILIFTTRTNVRNTDK